VEYYRRQPLVTTPETGADVAATVVDTVGRTLRQLLPLPSSAGPAAPAPASLPLGQDLLGQLPKIVPPLGAQPAATIVSEAAAILDEEMARGVLAARGARPLSDSSGADPANAVWRQLHDLIDNVSRLWPMHGMPTAISQGPVRGREDARDEGTPQLKPASPLRRGQRGTVSMSLCNREDRPVQLTPMATDLISSTGSRIPSSVFEFVPKNVRLEPSAQVDVVGHVVIPSDCTPGRFAGLLVVSGVDYLRAVVTIEVE
jgi:hypothetical protein